MNSDEDKAEASKDSVNSQTIIKENGTVAAPSIVQNYSIIQKVLKVKNKLVAYLLISFPNN